MANLIRVIGRLDIKGENLIKGVNLEGLRVVGKPNAFVQKYYREGIDEILLMDSVATLYGRNNLGSLIQEIVKNSFIPITVGGGIRSVEDAKEVLASGADKFAVNSAVVQNPSLIKQFVNKYGSQSVVISIESKISEKLGWEVYTHNGREKTGLSVKSWVEKCIELGAGEILLTSVDREGTLKGFDIEAALFVRSICPVPLVISGGMGKLSDLDEAILAGVDGVAVSHLLHYEKLTVSSIKRHINSSGHKVRF